MKLIDFYINATDKQKERLMEHIDNITASKERSPRKEKKKQKKPKNVRSAVMSPLGSTYYD